jgi:hypothetical protein
LQNKRGWHSNKIFDIIVEPIGMTPLPKSPNTKIAKGSTLSLSFSKENSQKKK